MHSFPEPALALVGEMTQAAKADPARAVAFQGAPGCNGHRAALEYDPDCLPLPCFSFEDALDAVKEGRAARAIIPRDLEVDALNKQIHAALVQHMVEHPDAISRCLHWMVAAKSLERIADHATNIAEDVVYLWEAQDIRHTGFKYQPSAT